MTLRLEKSLSFLIIICFLVIIYGCSTAPQDDGDATLRLEKASFSQLTNWQNHDLLSLYPAFEKSCGVTLRRDKNSSFGNKRFKGNYGGTVADWQPACKMLKEINKNDNDALRLYFETFFTPYQLIAQTGSTAKNTGLFTGYYEASLKGSTIKTETYQTPLHKRPNDLVMVDLGDFRDSLKGERIAGRVKSGRLTPFENRADIVKGALDGQGLELVYVDDPIEAFFLQIQGSGRIVMTDESTMRVGYDGQNGHVYRAIGRDLIEIGELTKETVSLQSIRDWLKNNPEKADDLKNKNPSYVFFRQLKGDGPVGGSGLELTPTRSLAIDYTKIPYHAPYYAVFDHPTKDNTKMARLYVTQDTGGAIRGPIRGDVFWGYGDMAETYAGAMKSSVQGWILLPKTVIIDK